MRVEPLGSVTDAFGKGRIAFAASAKLDRKDFGLRGHPLLEAGGLVVGDEVEISLEVQAVRAAAKAAA